MDFYSVASSGPSTHGQISWNHRSVAGTGYTFIICGYAHDSQIFPSRIFKGHAFERH